ncbi:hypothetical protein [Limnospira platensis]|uniref:hypothetical protein n=1 Tax=Limnospira platensis TaxID=118562 RepID=UPI003D6EB0CE
MSLVRNRASLSLVRNRASGLQPITGTGTGHVKQRSLFSIFGPKTAKKKKLKKEIQKLVERIVF